MGEHGRGHGRVEPATLSACIALVVSRHARVQGLCTHDEGLKERQRTQ